MNLYIITIGGTGSKCFEAIVHLGAMGFFKEPINILHIDADIDNGNWQRTFDILTAYNNNKKHITHEQAELFTAIFKSPPKEIFYPLPINDPAVPTYFNSLDEYFPEYELTQLLYTDKVRKDSWGVGFKGRASLGSIVITGAFDWNKEPWNTIGQGIELSLQNNEEVRIFLIGSIFGGTGASIFPSLGKLFGDKFGGYQNFAISGSLLFPYFQYKIPEGEKESGDYAKPENFLPKSKLHLQYYETLSVLNPFKRIYILGESYMKEVPPGKGGSEQENPSHHIELLAVMSATDFFYTTSKNILENKMQYRYLCRAADRITDWTALPDSANTTKKFLVFTTMACFFVGFWYPLLKEKDFKNSIWFKKYLASDSNFDDKLDNLKKYFDDYLLWLLGIHVNCGDKGTQSYKDWLCNSTSDNNIHLFNSEGIKDFLTKPTNIEVGEKLAVFKWRPKNKEQGYYEPNVNLPYDYLWEDACRVAKKIKQEFTPFEKLLHIIYETGESFVSKNYSS